jgi:hypothetical protein
MLSQLTCTPTYVHQRRVVSVPLFFIAMAARGVARTTKKQDSKKAEVFGDMMADISESLLDADVDFVASGLKKDRELSNILAVSRPQHVIVGVLLPPCLVIHFLSCDTFACA